jgi:hypothetical protein
MLARLLAENAAALRQRVGELERLVGQLKRRSGRRRRTAPAWRRRCRLVGLSKSCRPIPLCCAPLRASGNNAQRNRPGNRWLPAWSTLVRSVPRRAADGDHRRAGRRHRRCAPVGSGAAIAPLM